MKREDFKPLITEALKFYDGAASIYNVSKFIWENYHTKIYSSKRFLYTWQYDLRWAAQQLRDEGVMVKGSEATRGKWELI
jgi:hypothetical protein